MQLKHRNVHGDPVHQLRFINVRPTTAPDMVDYIIGMAIKCGASDIHLAANQNPTATEPFLLRFRISGRLQVARSDFLSGQYKEVLSRFKVLAGMNTTETHSPLDGQIQVQLPTGESLVLRVATVPGQDFEDITIRVQKSANTNHTLDALVMPDDVKLRLKHLIQQKSGMIVLNGPAGSGKTTTIYSMIGSLASPERKIITAEDPIESRLNFVNHVQVSPKASFASLCRSFMRQDADVIFIGEIRDKESAEAAIQLAQTGHLVLTTLHTRDSVGVISRLEALDIHPNLIATTLIGSLSQRLVPRLCPQCKVSANTDPDTIRKLTSIVPIPPGARFLKPGPGCPSCIGGIQGRLAIYELFIVDPEIADLINNEASKADVTARAKAKGMRNLAEDTLHRVYEGSVDLQSVASFIIGPEYGSSPATPVSTRDPDASRFISRTTPRPQQPRPAQPVSEATQIITKTQIEAGVAPSAPPIAHIPKSVNVPPQPVISPAVPRKKVS